MGLAVDAAWPVTKFVKAMGQGCLIVLLFALMWNDYGRSVAQLERRKSVEAFE
jgi:hypothetical protein